MRVDETAQPTVALALDASAEYARGERRGATHGSRAARSHQTSQALCQVSTALGTITDPETLLCGSSTASLTYFPRQNAPSSWCETMTAAPPLMPVAAKVRHGSNRSAGRSGHLTDDCAGGDAAQALHPLL